MKRAAKVTDLLDPPQALDKNHAVAAEAEVQIKIEPPKTKVVEIWIVGCDINGDREGACYAQNRFTDEALKTMKKAQEEGGPRKRGTRQAKNFAQLAEDSSHRSSLGWYGVPAAAFRKGMIAGAGTTGYRQQQAKRALFIIADGENQDGMPIVRIHSEAGPQRWIAPAPNANGRIDLRSRLRWKGDWACRLRVLFDAAIYDAGDVYNIVARTGFQIGVGAGRPDSQNSPGIPGYGHFRLATNEERLDLEQFAK